MSMFEREDWTLFRNLGTLCQKAGVPAGRLRRLVVKELVDNSLDAGAQEVRLGRTGTDGYWVQDDGAGIPGDGHAIARLFSVARPLSSTKVLRLPARGALGNGLRVVVGAVLATGGTLEVATRGTWRRLRPQDDGTTAILEERPGGDAGGTRVAVSLGPGLPRDEDDLFWGEMAQRFQQARRYEGKTSAWWYDDDSFYELLQAAGGRPLADLVEQFDGFGLGKADKEPSGFVQGLGLPVASGAVSRKQAAGLLAAMRAARAAVPAGKIGLVGPGGWPGAGYAIQKGVIAVSSGRGGERAELPYAVECWALQKKEGSQDGILAYVNGTPITGEMTIQRHKPTKVAVFGCGCSHYLDGVSRQPFTLLVNVTTPYMPITTDGKEPDLSRYLAPLEAAASRATRKLKSHIRRASGHSSQQDLILGHIDEGVALASGSGRYRYSLRQLFYAVRPHVLEATGGKELSYDHFSRVVAAREAASGELPGMYRDPRGTLYHPHLRRSIPLGTLAVEAYERPAWTFNKVLYIEKEGFANLLMAEGWPERHDCAILSSKGFASRAVRDVMDLLGETDEEVQFFCVHDADASGTLIYQALQEGTTARRARKVKIVNLGLEPWEATAGLGLAVERFEVKGGRKLPVAGYVKEGDYPMPPRRDGCRTWEEWLQGRRVELNAMTSPQFIAWLDRKMEEHGAGKVVPPWPVLRERLKADTEAALRQRLLERMAQENGLEDQVRAAMASQAPAFLDDGLRDMVAGALALDPCQRWDVPLKARAAGLAAGAASPPGPAGGPGDVSSPGLKRGVR